MFNMDDEDNFDNETGKQSNSRPWLYKKGQSGNPSGKKKGTKSMKTYIKERFEKMNDVEREEFLDGLSKETIWKMAEGNPKQDTDTKLTGEIVVKAIKYGDTDTL